MRYPGFINYAPLEANDIATLEKVYRQRWHTNIKRIQITYLAPVVLYWALLLVIFVFTGKPDSAREVLVYSVFLIPAYILVTLANAWLFLITMYPIFIDRKRSRKARILFHPEPYNIPESSNLYIKTGIPGFLFIEVGYEVYQYLDYIDEMVLEISPKTKIILGIKSATETGVASV